MGHTGLAPRGVVPALNQILGPEALGTRGALRPVSGHCRRAHVKHVCGGHRLPDDWPHPWRAGTPQRLLPLSPSRGTNAPTEPSLGVRVMDSVAAKLPCLGALSPPRLLRQPSCPAQSHLLLGGQIPPRNALRARAHHGQPRSGRAGALGLWSLLTHVWAPRPVWHTQPACGKIAQQSKSTSQSQVTERRPAL